MPQPSNPQPDPLTIWPWQPYFSSLLLKHLIKWYLFNRLLSSIHKNGRTDVCLFVYLLVCGGLMEIQTPNTDLDEIFHAYPHLSKEDFGAGLTPAPSPLGMGGLKP